MTTEKYGFTELASADANKFVTYNQNLRRLEAGSMGVISRTNSGPPVSPSQGDAYIVDSATGDWSAFTVNDVAFSVGGSWFNITAIEGMRVWVNDEDALVAYTGSVWTDVVISGSGLSGLTNNSVPYIASEQLAEDVNFNYDPGTDTLTVPNIIVTGSATTLDTTNLTVEDPLIVLGEGNATDSIDLGFIVERSSNNQGVIWDESADEFAFIDTTETGTTSGNVTIADYADMHAGSGTFDDVLLLSGGSSGAPSYTFTGDTDTGMYRSAANELSLVAGSVQGLIVTNSSLRTGYTGTAAAPAYSFGGDVDTGMYLAGVGALDFSVSGSGIIRLDTTGISMLNSGDQFKGSDGGVSTPDFTFSSDADTGMFRYAINQLGFACGGSEALLMSSSWVRTQFNGTAAVPAYSFVGDIDTGMYLAGVGALDFAVGGSGIIRLDTTGISMLNSGDQFKGSDGGVSTPDFTFSSDADTGMYRNAINQLGFACGGVSALQLSATWARVGDFGSVSTPAWSFDGDTDTGIYLVAAGRVGIASGGGVAAVFEDSSDGGRLSVSDTNTSYASSIVTARDTASSSTTADSVPCVNVTNTTASYTSGNYIGKVMFSRSGDSSDGTRCGMVAQYTATDTANNFSSRLIFRTSASAAGDGTDNLEIDDDGTLTFNAYGAGTLSTDANGVVSASDARLKNKLADNVPGRDAILALSPTWYEWKEGTKYSSGLRELGFIAQEVAKVIPEAAPGDDSVPVEEKRRNYHDRAIIAALVKHNQELEARLSALENETKK